MRIGIFTDQYYPVISGVVVSIKNLYETLEKMGHTCYIFSCNKYKGHEQDDEIKSKRIIFMGNINYPFPACEDYLYSISDRKYIKEIGKYHLDVIHVQSEFNIAKIARKASKKYHIPIVYTLHTAWTNYISTLFPRTGKAFHPFYVFLMRNLFTKPIAKKSVKIILPTKKMYMYLKTYGINKDKTVIIPTGIDMTRFEEENIDFNKLQSLKEKYSLVGKKVYLFVGRLAKEKNIPLIIKAYASAFSSDDNKRLLIVGGGPILPELKNEVEKNNIQDKVIFTDMIDWKEIPYYYRLGDFLINASVTETQGLTYIEALASKVPVIAQKDPCIEDVIIDKKNSFVFDGEIELVEKLKESSMLEDLNQIKENAYITSRDYTKEQFALKVEKLYRDAIEEYSKK